VHAEAVRQGINAVALLRSHRGWDSADTAKYESARGLVVTTYSAIFNSNPALSQPGTLLFDDAHAAEQFVAAAWSVDVSRYQQPDLYERLLDTIQSELSGLHVQRLQPSDPDPATRIDVPGGGVVVVQVDGRLSPKGRCAAGHNHDDLDRSEAKKSIPFRPHIYDDPYLWRS